MTDTSPFGPVGLRKYSKPWWHGLPPLSLSILPAPSADRAFPGSFCLYHIDFWTLWSPCQALHKTGLGSSMILEVKQEVFAFHLGVRGQCSFLESTQPKFLWVFTYCLSHLAWDEVACPSPLYGRREEMLLHSQFGQPLSSKKSSSSSDSLAELSTG